MSRTMGDIMRRKYIWIIAIIVILVVIGIAGKLSADHAAKEYTNDFNAWKQTERPKLLAQLTAGINPKAFPNDSEYTPASLDSQKKACESIKAQVASIDSGKYQPQALANSLFGFLSSEYREVSKTASSQQAVVDSAVHTARDKYQQLATDCTISNDFDRTFSYKNQLAQAKLRTTMIPEGRYNETRYCGVAYCLPETEAELGEYIKVYEQDIFKISDAQATWLANECPKTSLKPACDMYVKKMKDKTTAQRAHVAQLKTATNENMQEVIASTLDELHGSYKKINATAETQFKKAFPDYPNPKNTQASDLLERWIAERYVGEITSKVEAVKNI